jgi:hypothetical protein
LRKRFTKISSFYQKCKKLRDNSKMVLDPPTQSHRNCDRQKTARRVEVLKARKALTRKNLCQILSRKLRYWTLTQSALRNSAPKI